MLAFLRVFIDFIVDATIAEIVGGNELVAGPLRWSYEQWGGTDKAMSMIEEKDHAVWRPMVVVGQLLFCLACLLMCEARVFAVLMLSFMLYTLTATISGAPYTSDSVAVAVATSQSSS